MVTWVINMDWYSVYSVRSVVKSGLPGRFALPVYFQVAVNW